MARCWFRLFSKETQSLTGIAFCGGGENDLKSIKKLLHLIANLQAKHNKSSMN
jgi:hypothetical protein